MASQLRLYILAMVVTAVFGFIKTYGADEDRGPLAPTGLRVEYLADPMGVDTPSPRFFWVPEHSDRGQAQAAYEIIVSTGESAAEGDMWSTGKVAAASPGQVAYAGKPLESGATYFWKVRYWDAAGRMSPFSRPERFGCGLFTPADWKGQWIGGKNQLRKEFDLPKKVVRAKVFMCGLGYSELRLNGRKVGHHALDPAWTTYDKRALYVTYDVTGYLRPGPNAAAVSLGQGWFKGLALLFQLDIVLEGGERLAVVSDAPRMKAWLRLAGMGIQDFFDAVVTTDDVGGRLKPDPTPYKAALEKLGLKPGEVIFVGDNPNRDILGAKRLGIRTVLAKYGEWTEASGESPRPDFEIGSVRDLLKVLDGLQGRLQG